MQSRLLVAAALLIACMLALPLISLVHLSVDIETSVWEHLRTTVLAEYTINSLLLMLGVTCGTLLLGTSSAYIVAHFEFPGSRLATWALLLPLAVPTYISAYAYTGLLDAAGPIQTWIRAAFDLKFGEYWFIEIRSLSGAVLVFSLVLYPYVYLLTRAALIAQSPNLMRTAQLQGLHRWQRFHRVTIALSRPAIIAGLSLALMETLADYGAVKYFGVPTFTTGIYRTWSGLDSESGTAQLSLLLLSFIIVLVFLEKYSRQRSRFDLQSRTPLRKHRIQSLGWLTVVWCVIGIPILLGFLVPVAQLAIWAWSYFDTADLAAYKQLVWNSVSLATVTALIACVLSALVLYAHRSQGTVFTNAIKATVNLGYALPGLVIAVGILVPLGYLDTQINQWMELHFNHSIGLLFSGTLFALVFAYLVRFLTISTSTIEAGFTGIANNLDRATRSLGESPFGTVRRVHIPLLTPSIIAAGLLVFVEALKELPATLILRPFNFNTLAVRAFELASDERLPEAALASLTIVLAGLIPVILLTRALDRTGPAT